MDTEYGMGFYDIDGKPITLEQWGALRSQDGDYRRIAIDQVRGYEVSTVWLGLDHSMPWDTEPQIFETMVFGEGPWEDYCMRWSTRSQAELGHLMVVSSIDAGQDPE